MAMEIFKLTKSFPKDEQYSLTDQIRRASRSIPANLVEAWRKRRYIKTFIAKLYDCYGEAGEVDVWLEISKDCKYLNEQKYKYLCSEYEKVSKMIYGMIQKPEKFCH